MKKDLDQLCINTIRTLSMDAVQAANSGPPGTPMALAPAGRVRAHGRGSRKDIEITYQKQTKGVVMKIGIASDHGGFETKQLLKERLESLNYSILDFGNLLHDPKDDYPDYVIPLARAVANGEVERGIAVCGSGVGASIAANKVKGVRAALVHDHFAAHQGVEDDDMNVLCMGGRIIGYETAFELSIAFLQAKFSNAERHKRRLGKVIAAEKSC